MNSKHLSVTLSAAFLAAAAGLLAAGPLSPPAGAIGSTYKTLGEVEPRIAINATNTPGDNDASPSVYKITQPGSYYLTGNISVVQAKAAIEVATNNVTIDLNGFEINGNAVGTYGVRSTVSDSRNLSVKNGSISWFTSSGINSESDRGTTLNDLRFSFNFYGARIGTGIIVSRCAFESCSFSALRIAGGGTVDHCTVNEGGSGFYSQNASTFTDCNATSTTGRGFEMLNGGTITSCVASSCSTDGFWLQTGGAISNCQALGNTGVGISLNGDCTATNNACSGNATGIRAFNFGNRIDSNNVASNTATGIASVNDNNLIIRNCAHSNAINYSIVLGDFGQIISNPGNGFVATNPWANFAY